MNGMRVSDLMILPDEIIVIGDTVEAEALRHALHLCARSCHRHTYAAVWNCSAEDSRLKGNLRKSPLIIALSNSATPASQMAPVIYKLRTHFSWIGAFVAVVDNQDEVTQLNATSLNGDRRDRFKFSSVEGHATISRPLLLSELLTTINRVGEMHRHRWDGLINQTSAPRLLESVKGAEALIQAKDHKAAVTAVEQVLELVLNLDWLSLLGQRQVHQGVHLITELQTEYSQKRFLADHDCALIMEKVSRLIDASCIGDQG